MENTQITNEYSYETKCKLITMRISWRETTGEPSYDDLAR